MFENIKLFMTDVDGTLVNTARKIEPLTREAVSILQDHGIWTGIASGRPIDSRMFRFNDEYQLHKPFDCYIGNNGGQIYDVATGFRDEFDQLEPETIKEIITMMLPLGLNATVYQGDNRSLCQEHDRLIESAMGRNQSTFVIVKDLSEFWQQPTFKVIYRVDTQKIAMETVEDYVKQFPSDQYLCFKTTPEHLEFQSPNVNKGKGLVRLCKEMGLSMEEVAAFGDTTNDNDMLKASGIAVCMKNGSEDTKACADYITEYTNDEEGLGRFLFQHWIEPMGWA